MDINKLKPNEIIYRYIHIRQNRGIHTRPSKCITKLTNLDRTKDIYISRKNAKAENISHSMLNILMQDLKQGETIKLLTTKDYPQSLFDVIAACLSAKNLNKCIDIAKKFLDKNTEKLLA